MRSFLDGNGSDSTAAVQAYLAAHRQLSFADLYIINTAPQYAGQYLGQTFRFTDYPSPLQWNYKGTFKTAVISRGEVESKIGLDAATLDVTWSPQTSDVLATDSSGKVLLTALQGFGAGVFDNGVLEVWRCLMPTPRDCNAFGACCMFAGRIGNINPDRLAAKITVVSRLELLNVQVPTNVIEPTNVLAQYSVGTPPPNGPILFTVESGSTVDIVYANGSHAGYTPTDGIYDAGYLVFQSGGKLAGHYAKVYQQTIDEGEHAFYLQDSLPFAPTPGDTLCAFVYVPPDQASAVATGTEYQGWPNVPQPINSSIVI